jgi:chromosomal replication initiation ATPase DnaA
MTEAQKEFAELKRLQTNEKERLRYKKRRENGFVKLKNPNKSYKKKDEKPNDYNEMVRIAEVISGETKISIEEIIGKSRKEEINFARQCLMYFTQDICTRSFVGLYLSKRDHSTICDGIISIQDQIDVDPRFKAKIDLLRRKIKGEVIEAKQPEEMQYNWEVFKESQNEL